VALPTHPLGRSGLRITPEDARVVGVAREVDLALLQVDATGLPALPMADYDALRQGDLVFAFDNLPLIGFNLYTRHAGDRLRVGVLRGEQHLTLDVVVVERPEALDGIIDLVDPDKSVVPQLGILGVSIDEDLGLAIGSLRVPSAVMVAAHAEDRHAAAVSLSAGDVIHSINGAAVSNLQELRAALDGLKPHSAVVLQIERDGLLSFVSFELE
jgi:S1-C subfamily serine protease